MASERKPSRRSRAILIFAIAVLVVIGGVIVFQASGAMRDVIEHTLAMVLVPERFEFDDASLSLSDGRVTLDQLKITHEDAESHPFVAVDRVEVDVETASLGSFGAIRQIELHGLELDLRLDDGKLPDFSKILQPRDEVDPPASNDRPPAIVIRDSSVTLQFDLKSDPVRFDEVNLELLPEGLDTARMVLSGSMTSPAGLPTRVSGSGDFETQKFRAMLELDAFRLDPTLGARFSPEIGELFKSTDLDGQVEQVAVWIEFDGSHPDPTRALTAGAIIEVEELNGTPPGIDLPLWNASARIIASTEDHGTIPVSYTHLRAPRDRTRSRMPSSA